VVKSRAGGKGKKRRQPRTGGGDVGRMPSRETEGDGQNHLKKEIRVERGIGIETGRTPVQIATRAAGHRPTKKKIEKAT